MAPASGPMHHAPACVGSTGRSCDGNGPERRPAARIPPLPGWRRRTACNGGATSMLRANPLIRMGISAFATDATEILALHSGAGACAAAWRTTGHARAGSAQALPCQSARRAANYRKPSSQPSCLQSHRSSWRPGYRKIRRDRKRKCLTALYRRNRVRRVRRSGRDPAPPGVLPGPRRQAKCRAGTTTGSALRQFAEHGVRAWGIEGAIDPYVERVRIGRQHRGAHGLRRLPEAPRQDPQQRGRLARRDSLG